MENIPGAQTIPSGWWRLRAAGDTRGTWLLQPGHCQFFLHTLKCVCCFGWGEGAHAEQMKTCGDWGAGSVVKCLPNACEALSLTPSNVKGGRGKEGENGEERTGGGKEKEEEKEKRRRQR